jgi:hypothetical protein
MTISKKFQDWLELTGNPQTNYNHIKHQMEEAYHAGYMQRVKDEKEVKKKSVKLKQTRKRRNVRP